MDKLCHYFRHFYVLHKTLGYIMASWTKDMHMTSCMLRHICMYPVQWVYLSLNLVNVIFVVCPLSMVLYILFYFTTVYDVYYKFGDICKNQSQNSVKQCQTCSNIFILACFCYQIMS